MVTPKYGGCSSSLCFSWLVIGYKPDLMLLGSRWLPFFIVPVVYLMYEVDEFNNKHVNEVSRPANITAALLGFIFGALFRIR